ncbi:acyl-CoA dehydrogenase family protein [Blastococcus sp. BMG 814]|uniref:Acyl-CoA dehydrogenase family protein n=1 Tax=Blastococcus carthaginiensis TaxID=3050034 RepID=A0ABT9I8I2_9ACTN|nr:acyl-CoA dehydrogenase family protein [Blastococcus carthaginiensis]MDP5181875.1 acyl-CoA dehydrogenase family protein [Blastococcus carthaginiensis]
MQFELDDDLVAVRDLTEKIFGDRAEVERVRQVEADEGGHDRELWRILADAGVLGIPLPEDAGGAGMGMLGLVTLLEQQGRRVAPVPLWAALATAALPIAQFGTQQQVERWLPGLVDGSVVLTGAFDAPTGRAVTVTAEEDAGSLRLNGHLASVPGAEVAGAVLVPVGLPVGETAVAIVPTDRPGVTVRSLSVTSRESNAAVALDGVVVSAEEVLPGDGAEIARWTRRRARVALAALQVGVCSEALQMTARYTSERVQFGRPLSTNQAVAVRAADAYLDTESIRLTTQRAAWLMDLGQEEEAEAASLVAKWWASRGGLRAVHATQHLHGGIGADIDYPIHRYFLWGRQVAFTLGSADAVGAELGDALEHGGDIGAPA